MSGYPVGAQKPVSLQATTTSKKNPMEALSGGEFNGIFSAMQKKPTPQPVTAPLAVDNTNKFAGSGILLDVDPKYYTEGSKSAAAKLLLG